MSNILNNTSSLEDILNTINNLPEAGSGGTILPELSNEGSSADLLSGKQLINSDGEVVTGTIPIKDATTYTPTTSNQTIAAGTYCSGVQTIKGDANLVPANILGGKSIFGVTGGIETFDGSYECSGESTGGSGDTNLEDSLINRTFTSYTNSRLTSIVSYAFYEHQSLTSVNFPNCTIIGNYAFHSCRNLTTVSFPKCTNIGSAAFQSCTNLTTISFPNCTTIGSSVFYDCTNLTTVSLNCTSIENNAFYQCSNLTTVSFPKCTSIKLNAFHSCTKLSQIYLTGSSLCSLSHSAAFYGTSIGSNKGSIFVPASLVASYKAATNWAFFSNRIFGI